jgi:repressor LexA
MISHELKMRRKELGLTLEELAARVGTSKQTIHRYENGTITNIPPEKVEALANALSTTPAALMGWQEDDKALAAPIAHKPLPLLGRIACGTPIYATSEYGSFCTPGNDIDADFCLCASGDSMIGARIFDGDIVFIRAQDTVENGEIAAVIIGDEATLKRVYFYPEKSKLVLSPENPKYEPLVYIGKELEEVKILGKAVAYQSRIL